ncbi:hypothetical protein LINGRAHAP2_LOCUS4304 [Linum grandiflorum]
MRQDLIDHINVYWGSLYHNVYAPTKLEEVRNMLGWLSPTQCPEPYWLSSGYATLYNHAFVVLAKWSPNGVPYGETFLPMAHAYGTASPNGVTYLVCTGRHLGCARLGRCGRVFTDSRVEFVVD